MKKMLSLITVLAVMMLSMPAQASISLDVGYEAVQHEALVIGAGSGDVISAVELRNEPTILAASAAPIAIHIIKNHKTITISGYDQKFKDRPAWAFN